MTDDEVAALDGDWRDLPPKLQAAYAFARKFTHEPHLLNDNDIKQLQAHYTDLQILEMIMSMAGNNSINRWKEGAGIPQSKESSNFARTAKKELPKDRVLPIKTYLTPTSSKYEKSVTKLVPTELDGSGAPTCRIAQNRPTLEPRDVVMQKLSEVKTRKARLPLVSQAEAQKVLASESAEAYPNWVLLLANFPVLGKSRIQTQWQAEQAGELTPLVKAQVSWIVARQDRAWYATASAYKRLVSLQQSDDQIFALDGDWKSFSEQDRAMFTLARKLSASPIALTDQQVADVVKLAGNRLTVQLINFVTVCASFNRITEAAGLPSE